MVRRRPVARAHPRAVAGRACGDSGGPEAGRCHHGRDAQPQLSLLEAQQLRVLQLDRRLLAVLQITQVGGVEAERTLLDQHRRVALVDGLLVAPGCLLLLDHGPRHFLVERHRQTHQARTMSQWEGIDGLDQAPSVVAVALPLDWRSRNLPNASTLSRHADRVLRAKLKNLGNTERGEAMNAIAVVLPYPATIENK